MSKEAAGAFLGMLYLTADLCFAPLADLACVMPPEVPMATDAAAGLKWNVLMSGRKWWTDLPAFAWTLISLNRLCSRDNANIDIGESSGKLDAAPSQLLMFSGQSLVPGITARCRQRRLIRPL